MGSEMGPLEYYLVAGLFSLYVLLRKSMLREVDTIVRRAITRFGQDTSVPNLEYELRRDIARLVEPITNPMTMFALIVGGIPAYLLFWPLAFPLGYRELGKRR